MQVILEVKNLAVESLPETYTFDQPCIRIGRKEDNDLVLPDEKRFLSSAHAELRVQEDHVYLVDVGSKNSTFLNGSRLDAGQPYLLQEGDQIKIGFFDIQFNPPEKEEEDTQTSYLHTVLESTFMNLTHESALRRAVEELKVLNELAFEIGAARDLDTILGSIVRRSLRVLRAQQGVVTLIDQATSAPSKTLLRTMLSSQERQAFTVHPALTDWMIINKEPLRVNNPREDERFVGLPWHPDVQSMLCIPMLVRSEITGLLTVFNKKTPHGFTDDDERLLMIIAAQSAHVIERTRLMEIEIHARQLEAENQRKALELEKAKELAKAYHEIKIQSQEIQRKSEENERLLLNILPGPIADRLKRGEETIADAFPDVTVLFSDIVSFTNLSSHTPAPQLVALLNDLFREWDHLALSLGVEKIKTIGDAYMAVSGLPEPRPDHAEVCVRMALGMLDVLKRYNLKNNRSLQVRVGLNTGPVVAGVIGTHKFIYDLWGDSVNTASRMESHGIPDRIHMSKATYLKLNNRFACESRGEIEIKGKGKMETFLLKLSDPLVPSSAKPGFFHR